MREVLIEIWVSLRKNKLRTFLTGFSVAWGIFMLVILLGAGNGLQNGVLSNFGDMAVNSMQVYGGWTSQPYAGYKKDRRIALQNKDLTVISSEFDEVTQIGSRSYYGDQELTYGKEFISAQFLGASPEMKTMYGLKLVRGRFINKQDMDDCRRVLVVESKIREILFKNADPLGKEVKSKYGIFKVVGEYTTTGNHGQSIRCYIPITTGQLIYKANNPEVNSAMFEVQNIETVDESKEFVTRLRTRLSKEHSFAPDDMSAIWVSNNIEEYKNIMMIFGGIAMFVWIIGLGTLMAGIVGVSNIMLVTVRERTNEFGIRKALGARPKSIINLILMESVMITAMFGYVGMVCGVGVMEVVNYYMEQTAATSGGGFAMFKDPTLNLSVAVSATVVLVVAGLIAGYIPARRAARLKTIDALRFNK